MVMRPHLSTAFTSMFPGSEPQALVTDSSQQPLLQPE
jgi:hypothetical protein